MRLEVIHLDEALTAQSGFLAACSDRGADVVEARAEARPIRLWGRDSGLASLSRLLPKREAPTLAFLGSGDFHHVTALLLERVAEFADEPFTVVHFDNHPDWVRFAGGLHCGSWVNRALDIEGVAKVVTVGVCSRDLQHPELKRANLAPMREGKLEVFAYEQGPTSVFGSYGEGPGYRQEGRRLHWTGIAEQGIEAFTATLLSRIGTDAVYITVDKDVLPKADAITNWDQGRMRLDDILGLIRALGSRHRVIGADVIGDYSPVAHAGGFWPVLKKRGESFVDQPRVREAPEIISATNEAANLRLLAVFSEAMA